jgi:hypothetical protein
MLSPALHYDKIENRSPPNLEPSMGSLPDVTAFA